MNIITDPGGSRKKLVQTWRIELGDFLKTTLNYIDIIKDKLFEAGTIVRKTDENLET